jgi:uncharacterized protein YyaL (SSP411 family)
MAHESFEDPETAALMNRLFVCVKGEIVERARAFVDRWTPGGE